ncbi:unnamed protein product [Phaedon cochleariae]|uniref:Carboxylic ester hydrolase n=1 Tax=Phaedon cochleariae TaxID=80249 RepID=A0A9P0GLB3_PHACE|nr:unnamed protein product [Phaedon cochleariae]
MGSWLVLALSCIFFILVESGKICEKDVVVSTSTGSVKGCYTAERTFGKRKPLYWFRSIPFAEPPVGDLRFAPPQPKKNWTGVIDVSEKMSECVQGSDPVTGSEDCLYLKVYTTKAPKRTNNLPVMVWIYGGAFLGGSADFSDHAPDHLLDEDVIVVSFHYRVGVFGFLSTGDSVVPGNNGIKDQILALKWIKANIRNFGGDPEKITVFGQSAGAAAISYLLQTNETKGLFQKAIIQSGSSLSSWALSRSAPALVSSIAGALEIPGKSSEEMVQGLRSVSAELLQSTASSEMTKQLVSSNPLNGLVYGPVIEPDLPGAVITGKSHELLSEGKFHDIPLMVGYTSLEAMFGSISALIRVWLAKYDTNPTLLVPPSMNTGSVTKSLIAPSLKRKYFGLIPIAISSKKTMRFVSDDQFERPIQEAIRLYSAKSKVYFYRFSYQGGLYGITDRPADGVGHTEDLGYVFHFGYNGTEQDRRVRSQVVRMWTNFAKEGNPTPREDPLLGSVTWQPNGQNLEGNNDLVCLDIDAEITTVVNPNKANMEYWSSLYSKHGKPPYDTY